jgi:hypothetical protein
MAVRLSVGFQKKAGLPDYGSHEARCDVEFEIDASLLQSDLDGFHEKARRAFSACQQAVNDQLARQAANGHSHPPSNSYGHANVTGRSGNGSGSVRRSTQSQARAIRAIAGRQRLDLGALLGARFNVSRPEELNIADASSLIDELKAPSSDQGGH